MIDESRHADMPEPVADAEEREPRLVRRLRRRLAGRSAPPFEIAMPDGRVYAVGERPGVRFRIAIRNARGLGALASMQENAIAVAYMEGDLDVAGELVEALALRDVFSDFHPLLSIWRFLRPLVGGQVKADNAWVPQHYDHGDELYFTFLDKSVGLYSQALYTSEEESLEQAVGNKLDYILEVCRLQAGSHVLDVGGGWGAFEKYAGSKGVDATMLTISHQQLRYLERFAREHQMPCKLRVRYANIYDFETPAAEDGGPFDAIILLGVMEHLPDYQRLFRRFELLLKPNGRVYMDFAANRKKFKVRSFTYRYVFPGNHTPVVLSELLAAADETAFEPIAIHNDRHSYFLTLRAWARNLEAAREKLSAQFGERTFRLFQMYLWGCAHQMRTTGTLESYRVVFQKSARTPSDNVGVYRAV
ncbi:MAG TPA: class I SAM-dependent methyltransferase [Thermoanaerobaculia bacterium]|nr:class I SAM-dependent methyltransferase [Thermoanaerobaculia bacterium]